eukprot:4000975-Pyramimonas_sp.AAC.1
MQTFKYNVRFESMAFCRASAGDRRVCRDAVRRQTASRILSASRISNSDNFILATVGLEVAALRNDEGDDDDASLDITRLASSGRIAFQARPDCEVEIAGLLRWRLPKASAAFSTTYDGGSSLLVT